MPASRILYQMERDANLMMLRTVRKSRCKRGRRCGRHVFERSLNTVPLSHVKSSTVSPNGGIPTTKLVQDDQVVHKSGGICDSTGMIMLSNAFGRSSLSIREYTTALK